MQNRFNFTITLIIIIAASFIIHFNTLGQYLPEIAAVLFLIFFSLKHFIFKNQNILEVEVLFLSFLILALINSTGQVNSPYFFLIYFLLFSYAYLLNVSEAFIASLTIFILYLLSFPSLELNQLVKLLSIPLILPFSLYLSYEKEQIKKLNAKVQRIEEDSMLFTHIELKTKIQDSLELLENNNLREAKNLLKKVIKKINSYEV